MSDLLPRTFTGFGLIIIFCLAFESGFQTTYFLLLGIAPLVCYEIFRVSFGGILFYNPLKILIPNILVVCLFVIAVLGFEQKEIFVQLVAITMLSIGAADVGAYFFGKMWGKSLGVKLFKENYRLAPVISPNKTKVGAYMGIALGVLVFAILANTFLYTNIELAVYFGFLVVIVSVYGDLLESRAKRSVGEKDSGSGLTSKILYGHGGFWDRFDGQIPGLTVALLLYQYVI